MAVEDSGRGLLWALWASIGPLLYYFPFYTKPTFVFFKSLMGVFI